MIVSAEALPDDGEFDLIVVGAGAGGLAAALFGAIAGKSVLLIELTEFVGGTTALSAGTTWVPNSLHAGEVNPDDNRANASRFLDGSLEITRALHCARRSSRPAPRRSRRWRRNRT